MLQDIVIDQQAVLLDGYSSDIFINNLIVHSMEVVEPIIRFSSSSNLELSHIVMSNMSFAESSNEALISGRVDCTASVSNITYSDSSASLFTLNGVQGDIEYLTVQNVNSEAPLIFIMSLDNLSMSQSTFTDSQSGLSMVKVSNSYDLSFDSIMMSNVSQTGILMSTHSHLTASNITLNDLPKGINIAEDSSLTLEDSLIRNIGIEDEVYGGAVSIRNSNLTVINTVFDT